MSSYAISLTDVAGFCEIDSLPRGKSLAEFTASIAHEVNQPLSAIVINASTCLRMLAADPPNVDGAREAARRAIRDGNRASEIVTRLRGLFGKRGATDELIDLNELAQEAASLSRSELQKSYVSLLFALANDLPPVAGDRIQLQQVILNLVRNACDAMRGVDDRPGELLIKTEQDEDNCVRVSVQDTGAGFEPAAAETLFEPYYTTKNDGMGIGLAVSRVIIEAHHGKLWADRNDGRGSTFSFALPCARDCTPPACIVAQLCGTE